MTLVYEGPGHGPRMHAFVVGIGEYPYAESAGPFREFLRTLDSVSTAPASARLIADWLVDERSRDQATPLGSVELLLSWPDAKFRDVEVDPAGQANFEDAWMRWYDRCAEHPDNVALFYFCGHGCELGDQLLLLGDFGRSRGNPFAQAVSVSGMHKGMRVNPARTQCFVVDSCRTLPRELMRFDVHGWTPLVGSLDSRPFLYTRDAPIVFSTASGLPAYGRRDAPTPFARALTQVLGGAGADRDTDGIWRVGTDRLAIHIRDVLHWQGIRTVDHEVTLGGDPTGRGVLHTLSAPPAVPFEVDCHPSAARAYADLTLCGDGDRRLLHRPADPTVWCGEVPAGAYAVKARFAGAGYRDTSIIRAFLPPGARHEMVVDQP